MLIVIHESVMPNDMPPDKSTENSFTIRPTMIALKHKIIYARVEAIFLSNMIMAENIMISMICMAIYSVQSDI